MIMIHFTPSRKAWADTSPLLSTGNVESILKNGLRQFFSVAYDLDSLDSPNPVGLFEFAYHGSRANRKGLWGRKVIVPAVVIFRASPQYQPGYDGKYHAQVNEALSPDDVIGWFEFDGLEDFCNQLRDLV